MTTGQKKYKDVISCCSMLNLPSMLAIFANSLPIDELLVECAKVLTENLLCISLNHRFLVAKELNS